MAYDASYQYDRLPDETSLRILSLKPGTGDDPLVVALNTSRGEAINEQRKKIITCNQRSFGITSSLKQALVGLREAHKELSLWADAIYINQHDVQERNLQIKSMTRMYSNAKEVLVWLGKDPGIKGKYAFYVAESLAADRSLPKKLVGNTVLTKFGFRFPHTVCSQRTVL